MITKKTTFFFLALLVGALFFTMSVEMAEASSSGSSIIVDKTRQLAEVVIEIVQSISIFIAVVSVVFLGFKFFTDGYQAMIEAKYALIALIIALFIIFNGETIVGIIMKAVK